MFNWLKSCKSKGAPTTEEVALRAAALKLIIVYALVRASGRPPANEGEQVARSSELWEFVSPKEKAFLSATGPSQQDLVNASWRLEAMGTLMWALQLIPWLPPINQQFLGTIVEAIPASNFRNFAASLNLRSQQKVAEAREQAELWHWRSRTRQLVEEGRPFPEMPNCKSWDEVVRLTAKVLNEKGCEFETIDEDFLVGAKAYRDLSAVEWDQVNSITVERHFALNWLCGHAPENRWDETPTDT